MKVAMRRRLCVLAVDLAVPDRERRVHSEDRTIHEVVEFVIQSLDLFHARREERDDGRV